MKENNLCYFFNGNKNAKFRKTQYAYVLERKKGDIERAQYY